MPYQVNFWLAIATAAPIIALATVVGITESFKKRDRLSDLADTAGEKKLTIYDFHLASALALLIFVITLANLLAQAAFLTLALESLAFGDNEIAPAAAIIAMGAGVCAVALVVSLIAYLTAVIGNIERNLKRMAKAAYTAAPRPGSTPQPDEAARHSGDAAPPPVTIHDPAGAGQAADAGTATRPAASQEDQGAE